eukprot:2839924-Prymnesium_polylepis.1
MALAGAVSGADKSTPRFEYRILRGCLGAATSALRHGGRRRPAGGGDYAGAAGGIRRPARVCKRCQPRAAPAAQGEREAGRRDRGGARRNQGAHRDDEAAPVERKHGDAAHAAAGRREDQGDRDRGPPQAAGGARARPVPQRVQEAAAG